MRGIITSRTIKSGDSFRARSSPSAPLVATSTQNAEPLVATSVSHVKMRTISDEEIEHYCLSNEPMDKAGAYAIQGYASRFVTRIDGSYSNVVGLPIALVYQMLKGLTTL